jgi:hypothetical protein
MKVGDLIEYPSGKRAIVVRGLYNKRTWGLSGQSEDIEIVTRVDIRWVEDGKKQSVDLGYLHRYCRIISKIE